MKKSRKILFTAGLIVLLVAISIVCFIVGRGHTVYLDNKTVDDYKAYEYIDVYFKGEKITTLAKNERTVVTLTGQTLTLDLVVTEKRNSFEEEKQITIELPYNMDNILISLNSYLSGSDDYLSEFVSLLDMTPTEDETAPSEDELPTGEEVQIPVE